MAGQSVTLSGMRLAAAALQAMAALAESTETAGNQPSEQLSLLLAGSRGPGGPPPQGAAPTTAAGPEEPAPATPPSAVVPKPSRSPYLATT